jgi:hypothetical protein
MEQIKACFTGLYPLDQSPEGLAAYDMAMKNPQKFVLKPQREGGGNNIYGNDIPPFLSQLSIEQRNAYILMDLIEPDVRTNVMVKNGQFEETQVVSELGIYGYFLQ